MKPLDVYSRTGRDAKNTDRKTPGSSIALTIQAIPSTCELSKDTPVGQIWTAQFQSNIKIRNG